MHRLLVCTVVACVSFSPCALIGADLSKSDLDFFEKKIRPVLVKHCFECHSAASKKVRGKLLLDTRHGIMRGGESGPAIKLGKPDESLVIQSLRYQDAEMPPKQPLPQAVVNNFVHWVNRGAPYAKSIEKKPIPIVTSDPAKLDPGKHWSFYPRQIPGLPKVRNSAWPRDAIDRFVLARIEDDDLAPSNDAPPATLVRRLYYDLVGLPPTVKQVESFVSTCQTDRHLATQRLVDELLAKPQFGERWGRHWLDVARYGESNGDDGLGRNASFPHAWRYRDYVIQTLNDDIPYDQFLREQIAGDLLPATSAKQRNRQLVATGFLAIGAKPAAAMNKNFAMDIVDDQINVVTTAVMGLSVSCARCHDHKHDPIPTRDYYALAGIFNSTDTLYGSAAAEKLTAPPTELHQLVTTWNKTQTEPATIRQTPQFPDTYSDAIDKQKPVFHAKLDVAPKSWKVDGKAKFSSSEYASVNNAKLEGELLAPPNEYSVAFWFKNNLGNSKRPITAYLFSFATTGSPNTGDHLGIGGTHDKARTGKLFLFNGSLTKKSIAGETVISSGTWNHVVMVRKGDHVRVHLNGVSEAEFAGTLPATYGDSTSYFLAARADRFAPLEGNIAEFAIFDRALSANDIASLHSASNQPKGTRTPKPMGVAMGVREKGKPADCKVHINGETGKFGPSVPRGFPTAHRIHWKFDQKLSLIENGDSGRIQLATWLTQPDHPQTARVMVNRIWLHLFGQAIVSTPDDFGVYGSRPTHPELLDHLAHRFIQEKWSIKRLIRAIVLSRTYQLDSQHTAQVASADPDNKLFTRHLRRRLDAESLRDSLLTAAGNLDLSPGRGSAVEKSDILINWPPGESTNLHRPSNHRSIYLCLLRHAPPPELVAFDLPNPTTVVGARDETTLPTQSLFLLNSPFVVQQAKVLAQELLANEGLNDSQRVSKVYAKALQRTPTDAELRRSIRFIQTTDSTLPPSERRLRTWTSLCQSIFACNEFRYID